MIAKKSMLVAAALALASAAPGREASQSVSPDGGGDPKPVEKTRGEAKKTARKTSGLEPMFDEQADAAQQIAFALASARRENRRVLVEWGANWCSWCRMLRVLSASDPRIKRELLYEYDVVGIDVGRLDKNLDLAAQYGVDFTRGIGIPFLTILDADGKFLADQETGSLELKEVGRKGYDPVKVLDLLVLYQSPYLAADSLLAGALSAAKAEEKQVFLHFGAPGSPECRKLEGWMGSADAAPLLARGLVLVKIDVERTTGGKEYMRSLRKDGRKTLPWFAILDAQGSALATSEGDDCKNIQLPSDAVEIAQFAAMLRQTAKRLTPADIEALGRSLVDLSEADLREKQEKEKSKTGPAQGPPREPPHGKDDDGQEAGG